MLVYFVVFFVRVGTSERFTGGLEECGAYSFTYDCAHLKWLEWDQSSPAHSSLQTATQEPRRALGDSTSGPAGAGTLPPVRQGQWSVACYALELISFGTGRSHSGIDGGA